MAKTRRSNIFEQIAKYDENFVNSISLSSISSGKELNHLLSELEKANYVVTSYYEILYNDYITMINNDNDVSSHGLEIDNLKKYKSLASKIQKAYSYVTYVTTFENPFKQSK